MTPSPPEPQSPLTPIIDAHMREIAAAAERAALALQREVEEAARARGLELRRSSELDAARIRATAQAEADAYLEECRRRAEEFAAGRVKRLQELSDDLLAQGEAIRGRLLAAEDMYRSLEALIPSLTAAARAAGTEAARPAVELPRLLTDLEPGPGPGPAAERHAEPSVIAPARPATPSVIPMPVRMAAVDADTALPPSQVRDVARSLPRLPRRPAPPPPPPRA
jgi:hypothetical protein